MELAVIEQNNTLVVKDYETTLQALTSELDDFVNNHLVILDDNELKQVKEYRTNIRKIKDSVKAKRDEIYKQYVGVVCEQCVAFEKAIDNADKVLKTSVDNFIDKEQSKVITIEIKTYDKHNADSIVAFAEKLGMQVKVK